MLLGIIDVDWLVDMMCELVVNFCNVDVLVCVGELLLGLGDLSGVVVLFVCVEKVDLCNGWMKVGMVLILV